MSLTRQQIAAHFSGEFILPADPGYAEVSDGYQNPGAPAVVLLPATAVQVAEALALVQQLGLPVTIRSGGHNNAGLSTNRGGIVISLAHINDIQRLDDHGRVRVGSGATWGAVAEALRPHQLAISSGDTRTVGVGGLTLGGGIGWMVRKFGLALDSLLAVELVTVDGRILRASRDEHAELFWAVRGAGANFGVVTYFEFAAQRVPKVTYNTIMYSQDEVPALLRNWRDAVRGSREDVTSSFTLLPSFGEGMPPMVWVLACYAGPAAEAEPHLARLAQLATPISVESKEVDYADVLEDGQPPEGMQIVVKNIFLQSLTDEAIDAIAAVNSQPGMRVFQLRHLGGAVARVPAEETAFAFRDSEIMMFSAAFFPGDATSEVIEAGMQGWQALARQHGRGSYINFLSTASAEDVADIYPTATRARLAALKREYDPHNLLNSNYNVLPA
ncbi:MAG TPA: FAD-binding oxidoreductase [Anaerolineales bacterium]|nr:FAD-binding oxidoreductase [Anaerolineales bacterium]HRQ91496.1 FAD-binding oxidoreductase [Anaerolineales bacterium]